MALNVVPRLDANRFNYMSDVIEIACGNHAEVLLKRTSDEAIGRL